MASTPGGLSRRRVANTVSTTEEGSGENGFGSSERATRDTTIERRANGHAGTALEGGHRVAYDPEEESLTNSLSQTKSGKLPRLNLTEEVILIGLKDKAGYLSFWNDSISYALRGCILLELALRKRIAVVNTPRRRQFPLSERTIEVMDERMTGETLLDEALKLIRDKGKEGEKLSVNTWIDLMSGQSLFSFFLSFRF
jgi:golgi phosphoprotein 3